MATTRIGCGCLRVDCGWFCSRFDRRRYRSDRVVPASV